MYITRGNRGDHDDHHDHDDQAAAGLIERRAARS
jgi:hypothetical protein